MTDKEQSEDSHTSTKHRKTRQEENDHTKKHINDGHPLFNTAYGDSEDQFEGSVTIVDGINKN